MQGYIVSRAVAVRYASQFKWVGPAPSFENPHVADVQIAAHGELEAVTVQLIKDQPELEVGSLIKTVPQLQLAQWSRFPSPLGRQEGDPLSNGAVLPDQLQALRARHPGRKHFRLLLANGFGTNLGDTLIGIAAFRNVIAQFREHLPRFTVDVMLGPHFRDAMVNMFAESEGIGTVFRQGLSLQALARYQGFFDFSRLIALPRYGEMPPVDWYLWWLGLDPRAVPAECKRNSARLDEQDMAWVRTRLVDIPGKRILLNPKASEALRCMSLQAATALTDALLAQDPENQVLFDQPLHITRPRVFHLADIIDTPGRVSALVAQVDGVITVDTYLQHIADAVETPCCTLSASVPADHFCYYPYGRTLELPGARALPGWGKTKVNQPQWIAMQADYAEAWTRLSPKAVLDALNDAVLVRQRARSPLSPVAPLPRPTAAENPLDETGRPGKWLKPAGQLPDSYGRRLQDLLLELGQQILACGDTVVVMGAGAGELALALAARVAPEGCLLAFEPRRLIHQLLCANIVRSRLACVQAHCAAPVGAGFGIVQQAVLDIEDDHVATDNGNQLVTETVPAWPLDAMQLKHCRLIVLQRPTAMFEALAGALGTITRLRPTVLAGGVPPEELPQWRAALEPLNYGLRVVTQQPLSNAQRGNGDAPAPPGLVLIAEPVKSVSASTAGKKP